MRSEQNNQAIPADTNLSRPGGIRPGHLLRRWFVRLGVLPFLLLGAVVIFASVSDNFLTARNLMNVVRQSSYLTLVAVGRWWCC